MASSLSELSEVPSPLVKAVVGENTVVTRMQVRNFFKNSFFSNLYTQCGAWTPNPKGQQSHAVPTEPARHPERFSNKYGPSGEGTQIHRMLLYLKYISGSAYRIYQQLRTNWYTGYSWFNHGLNCKSWFLSPLKLRVPFLRETLPWMVSIPKLSYTSISDPQCSRKIVRLWLKKTTTLR